MDLEILSKDYLDRVPEYGLTFTTKEIQKELLQINKLIRRKNFSTISGSFCREMFY